MNPYAPPEAMVEEASAERLDAGQRRQTAVILLIALATALGGIAHLLSHGFGISLRASLAVGAGFACVLGVAAGTCRPRLDSRGAFAILIAIMAICVPLLIIAEYRYARRVQVQRWREQLLQRTLESGESLRPRNIGRDWGESE